ncbi:MAG: hypothetical protein SFY56_13915 [Bacteroidota bacterium]|nr:hypothetical protein [Bacteroidota bacterium]
MKKTITSTRILIAISIVSISSCHSKKKSTSASCSATTTVSATTVATSTALPVGPIMVAKSSNGIYAPGNEELVAIQTQYKDVTIEKLKQGHVIYTSGACIKCHEAMSIYQFGEARWKNIIDDMAQKAQMEDEQKDAVYKYVLSIKATQPK